MDKTKIETIDVTPTWVEAVASWISMWDSLKPEGKEQARKELLRCAALADKYVELTDKK